MNYLVMSDINTDEKVNRGELDRVNNISVFKGKKINKIVWLYRTRADHFKQYIMVQYDNCSKFIVGKKNDVYIQFE